MDDYPPFSWFIFALLAEWRIIISEEYKFQVRSEITHQQESINRVVRYGSEGGLFWHTHTRARSFGHLGQPLGVGLGISSNSQIAEFALVKGIEKMGVLLERLENHQDFYYRAFG